LKDVQTAICSPHLDNGEYTKTENETLEELLQVHFAGSKTIIEPSGGWDGLELEFPKWNVFREDWAVSRRAINVDKLKWAIFSFHI
jgi:hypothetical protein